MRVERFKAPRDNLQTEHAKTLAEESVVASKVDGAPGNRKVSSHAIDGTHNADVVGSCKSDGCTSTTSQGNAFLAATYAVPVSTQGSEGSARDGGYLDVNAMAATGAVARGVPAHFARSALRICVAVEVRGLLLCAQHSACYLLPFFIVHAFYTHSF